MKTDTLYREVFEPEVTALAPRFADRAVMVTREGEIRVYGCRPHEHENGNKNAVFMMLRSVDNGLSFTMEEVPADDPGARTASPWSDGYITMISHVDEVGESPHCKESHVPAAVQLQAHLAGTYVYRSAGGPDGPWEVEKISDNVTHLQRLPLPLKKWKRWINIGQKRIKEDNRLHPVVFLGDADGRNWTETVLPAPPIFEQTYPHKGMRWYDPGVEPAFAETPSGRILMLLRTSRDVHYECYSDDGGVTWSEMKPSIFYAVATMPGIYSLSDGRMIAIWNNTCPLPEVDHTTQPLLGDGEIRGDWEDVFTNRDAIHAAISEDEGKTWKGFREITLSPVRNNGDFRTNDGSWFLNDKSVHQNQLFELPGNKVLLHCGQHIKTSRIILFDLDFLYAKERSEDFSRGLENWSTHLYYKSHSGGFRVAGHCAWNRRTGAQLMPSPEGDAREALLIGRHPDDRLFSDREGAVWNFPGSRQGKVTADFTVAPGTAGLRISLADRWINPCDEYVGELSPFSFILDGEGKVGAVQIAEPGKRSTLELDFDLDRNILTVSGNGKSAEVPYGRTLPAPFGKEIQLSYLHLQTAAETADSAGVYLHTVHFVAK